MAVTHSHSAARIERPSARTLRRAGLAAVCALAIAGAWAASDPAPMLRADPELAALLRGMAALKALLALGAGAAVFWRFGLPISNGAAALYALCVAALFAGATAIWQLSHIGAIAIAFHGALIALGVLALRDEPIAAKAFRSRDRA